MTDILQLPKLDPGIVIRLPFILTLYEEPREPIRDSRYGDNYAPRVIQARMIADGVYVAEEIRFGSPTRDVQLVGIDVRKSEGDPPGRFRAFDEQVPVLCSCDTFVIESLAFRHP